MKNSKQKLIALVSLVVAVIGLTIAFAALASNLTISGNAKLEPINWNIYFDNIDNISPSGKATINSNPVIDTSDKRKIKDISVILNEPGDKVSFTVDLVNESDITAIIDTINMPTINYNFIEFKVLYTGTNREVKTGDVINAKTDSGEERTNIEISIYYSKEKVTNEDLKTIPSDGLNTDLSYGLTFTQSDREANTPITDSGFPILTGKLGDNITFTYNNGNLSINGYGEMYDGVIVSGDYCDGYSETTICTLASELAVALNNAIKPDSEKVASVIKEYGAYFMAGYSYEIMEMSESNFKNMLMTENNGGLTEKEADEAIEIINSIPKLKKIVIQNDLNSVGITLIREELFALFNAGDLKITLPKTISVGNGFPFVGAKFGTLEYEQGTKTIYEGTGYAVDGEIDNVIIPDGVETIKANAIYEEGGRMTTIIIPSSVKEIENFAISPLGLTTVINKTGRAFDWYGILTGTSGDLFETGTVNDGDRIITITK